MPTYKSVTLKPQAINIIHIVFGLFVLFTGWVWSQIHLMSFHFSVEFASAAIAIIIFIVGWKARWHLKYNYIFVMSVFYGCVGFIDIIHFLTYNGSNLPVSLNNNASMQLWLLARVLESTGLAWVFITLRYEVRIPPKQTFWIPGLTGIAVIFIYPLGVFPIAHIDGYGLTSFKIVTEYIVIVTLLVAMLGLFSTRHSIGHIQKRLYTLALTCLVAAEFCFSQYGAVYPKSFETGHVLKLLALYLLYHGITQHPYLSKYGIMSMLNFRPLVMAILIGLMTLAATFFIYDFEYKSHLNENKIRAQQKLQDIGSSLELAISIKLSLTNSIKAFVSSNSKVNEDSFNTFATNLHQSQNGIMSLQLAPGGVVRYVTDIERNQKAIGHDLLGDKNRKELALKAIELQKIIIVGPVNLIQGGRAIIARQPIYKNNEPPGISSFWGFAIVLIDMDQLLRDIKIFDVFVDHEFAIRGKHGRGELGEVFFGDKQIFNNAIATRFVSLPNGRWQLAITLRDEIEFPGFILSQWYWSVMFVLSLLVGFTTYIMANRPYRMKVEIRRATEELRQEINKRVKAEERARYMAEHDGLTGLPNRLLFNELAYSAIKQAKRKKTNISLFFLDVDGFKPVNDTYGHNVGDDLLKQISHRLKSSIREADIVARIGGDEFIALLLESEGSQINIAKKIIHQISGPFDIQGNEIKVGISIGISRFPVNGTDLTSLIKSADAAMYDAKRKGPNKFQIASG